jgi:3-dehydroquinate synthase
MRVLVTGAQGFVGRWLVADWLERDPTVTVLGLGRSAAHGRFSAQATRRGRPAEALCPPRVDGALRSPRCAYAQVDLLDAPRLRDVVHAFAPDVVVHLATALKGDTPTALLRSNVEGVAALLQVLGALPHRPILVLGSTGAVYGPSTPPDGVRRVAAVDLADPYALSKRMTEEWARTLGASARLDVRVARIFNPVGPGLDERHLPASVASALTAASDRPTVRLSLRLGEPRSTRDFVDVRDVASALRLIATHPDAVGGTFDVGRGVATPVTSLVECLIDAAGLTGRADVEWRAGAHPPPGEHRADPAALSALGFSPRHDLRDMTAHLVSWYGALPEVSPFRASAPMHVEVVARHTYEVEVERGLLDAAAFRLRARLDSRHAVVLTDPTVARLYGDRALSAFRAAGFEVTQTVLPEGEAAKRLDVHHTLVDTLHDRHFARRSVLVCLGGATVSDVGGFVAATFMRGVPYANLPTTLLAQHDGAVGGKVAVNTAWAKNAVGAFHHPIGVYCDPNTLTTLDDRNLSAGIAESIKVALTGDATLFALLEAHAHEVLMQRDPLVLEAIVRRSAAHKIAMLAPDPLEVDLRRPLNLGHTLAHALETELAYSGLLHGEAVGFGLAVATAVSRARGWCTSGVADRILSLLRAYRLPPVFPSDAARAALGRLDEIRRVRGGALHFVAPVAIDAVRMVAELEPGELAAAVAETLALPSSGRVRVAA